jgi:hypothetical protein
VLSGFDDELAAGTENTLAATQRVLVQLRDA